MNSLDLKNHLEELVLGVLAAAPLTARAVHLMTEPKFEPGGPDDAPDDAPAEPDFRPVFGLTDWNTALACIRF